MKLRVLFALAWTFALTLSAAAPPEYQGLKADAEKLFAEGSFAKANELYNQITLTNLTASEQRWVRFRRADTQWRSQAATQTADTTRFEQAQRELESLVRDITRPEDRDRVWVEVHESLGDFFWVRRNQRSWGEAWPHYQQVLDWWAGAADIEMARQRYLGLVWKITSPVSPQDGYSYWGQPVPLDVLQNALKIAQSENDKARLHYYIAISVRYSGGDWMQRMRVPEEFEAAIKPGKTSDWYDDALFNYAEWMMQTGRIIPLLNGSWSQEPDYAKALELYRRIVTEFNKGESRYWDQAQGRIKEITDPQVNVSVPNIFLPDSEIQYTLNWRNVKQIELELYPVDLNRDTQLTAEGAGGRIESINVSRLEKVRSWTYATTNVQKSAANAEARAPRAGNDYKPGQATVRLDGKLKPGAYLLLAKAGGKESRELVLVTDTVIVLKTSGTQALIFLCNALNGSPATNGTVKIWERWYDGRNWQVREQTKQTGADGVALFDLEARGDGRQSELFATAMFGDRQAYCPGYSNSERERDSWRIYASTDRPAYRPKETAQWKFTARRYRDGSYSTPNEQVIEFEIADPRGVKVKADKVTLNSFGSAWGSIELTEQMPLGEYRVTFWDNERRNQIGNATLFRLEEYKLPEFKVTVQTPEESGPDKVPRRKTFLLGEKVEVSIQADYYFGGPVANATVEVLVHQNPYWQFWYRKRDYPWYYADMESRMGGWDRYNTQVIKRETLKTDAMGKATLSFDTPANTGQDYEYRIEARVTDSSRREIIGNGTVRVARQRYYVHPNADHNLYRPQDKVGIDFKALDANDQPVQTEGTVKVTRDYWFEIWLAPDGHEVKGEELKRMRSGAMIWPPAPERPDQKGWTLRFRGYEHDDILTRTLKTDTNGEARLTFTPEREGYYRIGWTSQDGISNSEFRVSNPIRAETTVWVADNATTELGYRHGGVEIIVDKDTFRAGSKAPVMLVAPTSDRYVLFCVEGDGLYSYQVVHLTGTVKLIELPIEEKHVPNIFLNAALVNDRQIFTDTKQVIVPPTKNFLTVDVKPDRTQYQPRDEGSFTVTTKNDEGKPVSAEVAFGLVDESVFYIQSDYAGDPRQFFFGTKRSLRTQTQSTMNQKAYIRLVEGENEQLIDDRFKKNQGMGRWDAEGDANGVAGAWRGFDGGGGGGGGGMREERLGSLAAAKSINAVGSVSQYKMADMSQMEMPMTGAPFTPPGRKPGEAGQENEPAVQVRTDFRSTILWQPDLMTDNEGKASVKVKYPDSLTGWKATARTASSANQFGIAEVTTRTKQPLIVRLQAPRFFVVGDVVTISAVINNNTDRRMRVSTQLEAQGLVISGLYVSTNGAVVKGERAPFIDVEPNSEARADWAVTATEDGIARLKVTGRGDKYADAMEKTYTVYEHGIEKFIAKSGKARGTDITVKLDLPSERKSGSATLTVQLTPSMAVTMLDALPYLIDYPYGCTEQTMSRFLPSVITAKTLRDLGLEPATVMGRVFGGVESRAGGSPVAPRQGGQKNLDELDRMVKAGLDRLYNFQHNDGGWGWWKEGDSDHWMTAYVVWGLTVARDAGVSIRTDALRRGADYLNKEIVEEEENYDMQAFMLHALAVYRASAKEKPAKFEDTAFTNLWNNREKLNAYTRALLALSAHAYGKSTEAKTLIANLENGVKRDDRPDTSVLIKSDPSTLNSPSTVQGTAHWGEDGIYWRWSEGGVEATAFGLRALLAIDPQNKLVEPVTNWLIKNRRGAQWSNTRDTAIVVLTMNDYLRVSGELKVDAEYEVFVNGVSIAKRKVAGADVFNAPSRFAVDPKLIRDSNEVRIHSIARGGNVPALYFAAEAKFFSLEEPVAPAGNEIFVKREYFKLVGRPTLLKGYVYEREPLGDGETVKSGERVETLLTIEAKNNYEYLIFEDLKPAGLEAVEVRSGQSLHAQELKSGAVDRKFKPAPGSAAAGSTDYTIQSGDTLSGLARRYGTSVTAIRDANNLSTDRINVGQTIKIPPATPRAGGEDYTGRTRWVYQELRDRKVALFIDKLPEGVWEIKYDLRAEVPGKFHALPVMGQAMYVPEIRANGAELRLIVEDAR